MHWPFKADFFFKEQKTEARRVWRNEALLPATDHIRNVSFGKGRINRVPLAVGTAELGASLLNALTRLALRQVRQ